jgi:hypothetical protein
MGRFAEFTEQQWLDFFQRVETMDMTWHLRDTDVSFLHEWRACRNSNCSVDWHFTASYSFTSAGKLRVSFAANTTLSDLDTDETAAGTPRML